MKNYREKKMDDRRPAWKQPNDNKYERQPYVGPIEVIVRNNDISQALKILKNKMSAESVLTELRRKRFAEKPSERRRRKHREAIKRLRKSRGRKAKQRMAARKRKNG
jgi:small subunit ribosomal protein S21